MKRLHLIIGLLWCFAVSAAEIIPPAPKLYFNDYAGVVSSATASRLNQTLESFEKQTSEQIVVAVFPKMESDSSIEDYALRVARAWQVGQKNNNNGAVLFVFTQDRKISLQVGYGLEGVLPDALCKRIISDEITPRFKNNDYDGGLSAGVAAMIAATKGEYKGTGRTVNQSRGNGGGSSGGFSLGNIVLILIVIVVILSFIGRRSRSGGGWIASSGGFGGWGGGGGWSGGGGGGFSGGGGGFSGGGGSFGGGGAGGSW